VDDRDVMPPSESPVLILGHRGAPADSPENTIVSFREAMRQGAHGVELDVQRSRDGVPVVIHDDTLERTTSERGRISDLTWEELSAVRAGGEPLPSLTQAVAWAAAAGAFLNVEIKAPDVEEATLSLLAESGMLARTIISSFNPAIVRAVGDLAPHARRYLLLDEWGDDSLQAIEDTGAQGVCLSVNHATPAALDLLRSRDLPVIAWTVNEPVRVGELLAAGVAGIITNHPEMAVGVARTFGMLR
jgi:glycerophosphoryl diester phosphodiesterase